MILQIWRIPFSLLGYWELVLFSLDLTGSLSRRGSRRDEVEPDDNRPKRASTEVKLS